MPRDEGRHEETAHSASHGVVLRLRLDGQRFPPACYEEHCLLWKGSEWRQPSPIERAEVMGVPTDLVKAAGEQAKDHKQRVQRQNSYISNTVWHCSCPALRIADSPFPFTRL